MTDLATKIRSRGYWRFVIRPVAFMPDRLAFGELEDVVRRHVVQFRGWDFPHIDKEGFVYGADFVGSDTDWAHHVETWRLYQSGQFVHLSGMGLDWRDQSWVGRDTDDDEPKLGITDTVWTITEAVEFAARLATTDIGNDGAINVAVEAGGLEGRVLYVDDHNRAPLIANHVARVQSFAVDRTPTRDELLANGDMLAIELAVEMFLRFGWRPNVENLRSVQEQLRRL